MDEVVDAVVDSVVDEVDVVVVGTGSGGEVVAEEVARAGWSVAAVEAGLVGGECPYLACVPSKAMLLAARRHRERGGDPAAAWADAVRRRDEAAEQRQDAGTAGRLADAGVTVVRGHGRVATRGTPSGGLVTVTTAGGGGRRLGWRRALVIGTGSAPTAPPVEGLDAVPTWTSDEALSSPERPARLLVLGGGAVGCELAQVYASFGVAVTLADPAPTLLGREPGWVGATLARVLRAQGVDVRTRVAVEAVAPGRGGVVARFAGGAHVVVDRVLVAAGRAPRTADLGLEVLGVDVGPGAPLDVDPRCRLVAGGGVTTHDDVFAVGDVTGVAPYTHTASYQGRIVAAHLLGRGRDTDYSGVPRAVYTDPAVLCVGMTSPPGPGEADGQVRTARFDVGATARAFLEHGAGGADDVGGQVELVADARSGVLLGASAVGPAADAWGGELALAVRARVTVDLLADHVRAFPTWSEAIRPAAADLAMPA